MGWGSWGSIGQSLIDKARGKDSHKDTVHNHFKNVRPDNTLENLKRRGANKAAVDASGERERIEKAGSILAQSASIVTGYGTTSNQAKSNATKVSGGHYNETDTRTTDTILKNDTLTGKLTDIAILKSAGKSYKKYLS